MAGSSLVLADNTWLSRLDRALLRIELVMVFMGGLTVFALMLLAVFSVGGRNFFNAPLPGYVDWIEQLMPVIAILGVSYVRREGGHIRMDIVVGALRGRVLWAAEFATTALILLFVVLIFWGSWQHFDRSFEFGQPMWSRDSSMDIGLPVWPAKLVVPTALGVLALRLCLQLWGYGRALIRNDPRPVAVPLEASVATQAAMEARQVSGRDA